MADGARKIWKVWFRKQKCPSVDTSLNVSLRSAASSTMELDFFGVQILKTLSCEIRMKSRYLKDCVKTRDCYCCGELTKIVALKSE